ncbi:ImmA/IrrE family metallo-endopeptidase [Rhodobacteraceae bacterium R_SAG7]|nr:ImmA/IrrE family metallo-endopeptidase [Rhodobacteraceae bacterium R_SAG7]
MKEQFLASPRSYSAQEVLEIAGITEPPVDLGRVLEAFGLSLNDEGDFDKLGLSGSIEWTPDRKSVELWINPIEPEVRQRFTISHELGHLFRHMLPKHAKKGEADTFKDTPNKFHRDGSTSKVEREANQFAARLLMPGPLVRQHAKKLADDNRNAEGKIGMSRDAYIEVLANKFNVSKQSMEYRLKNLRVLS